MSKKKITLFLPSLANGGAERVMLNIAIGLANDVDIQVDIVLCKAEGPYLEHVPSHICIVDLECNRIITSIFPLIKYLRREKPKAVLSALDTANLVLIWASWLANSKARNVVAVHCNFSSAIDGQPKKRARLLPYLVKIFYPWADKILAVSDGVKEDLAARSGLNKQLISVQANPVITPHLESQSADSCSHPWFKLKVPVIVATGRLTFQKNFELLIRAVAKLRKQHSVKLIILGEGEEKAKLQQIAIENDLQHDIDFPGFIDNPFPFMRESSLFVMSSRYEGLPTVLIEALFCGATVISTDCPSGPSEILDNGRLGKLVPIDNVENLAYAMETLLSKKNSPISHKELRQYFFDEVITAYKRHLNLV